MGGRGSSSMSARGQATKVVPTSPQAMTGAQLEESIDATRRELGLAAASLDELSHALTSAQWSPREVRTERMDAARRAYNEGSDLFNALRDRLSALEDERRRRRPVQEASYRPFVNSYGEATTRTITNQTYERAQRRLEREVQGFLGR